MIASMEKGVAIRDLDVDMDFQQLNGFCMGTTYEITKGKRSAILANAGILFRTPEFWKSLTEVGGPASARRFGQRVTKGEPRQESYHSATAVSALFKEQTVIDVLRKA
jgi:predicted Zn-dependent protease